MTPTNRTYQDVETLESFRLFTNHAHEYALIHDGGPLSTDPAKGTEVNGFYISTQSAIVLKLNSKKIISLSAGQFYNLKENEVITHTKREGLTRFSKIK